MSKRKWYYPEIQSKIKLKFVNTERLYKPYPNLEFYYLEENGAFLHIPSNTQLSEYLNKFNEAYILPMLGRYMLNKIRSDKSFDVDVDDLINNYGWNWINWNSDAGKRVLYELGLISSQTKMFTDKTIYPQTLKVLGRIKLKQSTDYGNRIEAEIINYLKDEDKLLLENQSIEVQTFFKKLKENNLIVIGYKLKFFHPQGIFTGEIDFLLINTETNMIHVCDLKTSSRADTFDYWRQVSLYQYTLKLLNPHLGSIISNEVIIIQINNLKDSLISNFYIRKITDNKLLELSKDILNLKQKYLLSMGYFDKAS